MLDISKRYDKVSTNMANEEREGKLIRLPDEVWNSLRLEGVRCRRSLTKQLEAILVAYYRLDSVELMDMEHVREKQKEGSQTIEVIEFNDEHKISKRKRKA